MLNNVFQWRITFHGTCTCEGLSCIRAWVTFYVTRIIECQVQVQFLKQSKRRGGGGGFCMTELHVCTNLPSTVHSHYNNFSYKYYQNSVIPGLKTIKS